MDYRSVLHPVGPLAPRVYWTRRVAVLAVLLVVIIALAVSCSGGSNKGHPTATAPTSTPTPSPKASVTATACRKSQLAVTATTDAATYPAGVLPSLQVSIRNTGDVACVLTESPRTRSWTIVSGTDRVWTTVGCQAPATSRAVTLKPGGSVRHAMSWNRHRSGKGCASSATEAAPGTYQLTVSVNGITSTTAVFHLSG